MTPKYFKSLKGICAESLVNSHENNYFHVELLLLFSVKGQKKVVVPFDELVLFQTHKAEAVSADWQL